MSSRTALFTKQDQKELKQLLKQIKKGEVQPEKLEEYLTKSCAEGEDRWKRFRFK